MLVWEIVQYRQLRKLNQKGFEKTSEADRRSKNSKWLSYVSIAAMFMFIVLIVLGGILADGRACGENQVLENAVCMTC